MNDEKRITKMAEEWMDEHWMDEHWMDTREVLVASIALLIAQSEKRGMEEVVK